MDYGFDEPKYRGAAKLQPDVKESFWFDEPAVYRSEPPVYRSVDAGVADLSLDDLPRPRALVKSSMIKDLSMSADLRHAPEPVKPLPLPDFPVYHEPRSSFTTSNSSVLGEIGVALQAISGLEVQFVRNAHKIKCSASLDGDSCTFRVHMFKGQVRGQFLVEFQRRSGCCVVFRKVYSQVSSRFLPKGEKQEKAAKVPSFGVVILDGETADLLTDMVSVSKSDQQRDTLRLLADCSTIEENRNKIVAALGIAKLTGVLLEAITSRDRDSERYGCVILANLCGSPSEHKDSIQREVANQMFAPLCALLSLDSLGSSETKRHVLKCIDSLSPSLVGEVRRRHSEALKGLSGDAQGKDLASSRSSLSRFLLEVQ